ncbi:prisilkin-39-like isoform X1 [Neodiprion pinetum]|uniref:prisilkin-39-like isoform X1 n=2 Tax=Neodiprion pinetum TaxID=441929 RepID=UPI001EDEFDC2|nr:heterogeneous nuclear ribonucleoprotein A3 homolog 2-like isoform X1 [Neodiprion pinetum]
MVGFFARHKTIPTTHYIRSRSRYHPGTLVDTVRSEEDRKMRNQAYFSLAVIALCFAGCSVFGEELAAEEKLRLEDLDDSVPEAVSVDDEALVRPKRTLLLKKKLLGLGALGLGVEFGAVKSYGWGGHGGYGGGGYGGNYGGGYGGNYGGGYNGYYREESSGPSYVSRPVYVETPVYVDRPVYVEKQVYVPKPVYVERLVYVEKPVLVKTTYGHVEPTEHRGNGWGWNGNANANANSYGERNGNGNGYANSYANSQAQSWSVGNNFGPSSAGVVTSEAHASASASVGGSSGNGAGNGGYVY